MDLPERLIYWAQNEEMIDSSFLAHGRDCLEAAEQLRGKNKPDVAVQARDYAEAQADAAYRRSWPIPAAQFEAALARAFEAGWRAKA